MTWPTLKISYLAMPIADAEEHPAGQPALLAVCRRDSVIVMPTARYMVAVTRPRWLRGRDL